jgi:hypothetical protein
VPYISFLLDMLSCEGSRVERARGVECWEGVHIFYATMAAAALLTLLLASIVKGGLQNRWAHEARNPERMVSATRLAPGFRSRSCAHRRTRSARPATIGTRATRRCA